MTKDDKKRYLILKEKSIIKGIFLLAIPIMLSNLIKTLHDIVDMLFVSRIEGYGVDSVSSISLTFPIVFAYLSLGMGLGVAGTALISQYVGADLMDAAKKYATNLVKLSLILGLILMIFSILVSPLIMSLMGTKGYVLENSVLYLRIRAFELPFLFIFFAYTAIRQASGDTLTPVVFGVIALVINIILSPILIEVFNMGVAGAAYATLFANIAIAPMIVYQLFFSKSGVTICKTKEILNKTIAKDITKIALPASLGQAITAIGFIVMNTVIIGYGIETVAAFNVGNRLASIILHPVMAIGGVLSAYIGQNLGNQNIPRARMAFRKGMLLSVSVMVLGSLIVMNYRSFFAGFFFTDDPDALALAVEYMFFLLIGLPLMAVFQTFLGTFNGTGNTKYSFILAVTRLWVLRVPLILIFKYYTDLGNSGIWYAMLTSNFLIAFVGIYLYRKVDFKPKIDL